MSNRYDIFNFCIPQRIHIRPALLFLAPPKKNRKKITTFMSWRNLVSSTSGFSLTAVSALSILEVTRPEHISFRDKTAVLLWWRRRSKGKRKMKLKKNCFSFSVGDKLSGRRGTRAVSLWSKFFRFPAVEKTVEICWRKWTFS